MFPALIPPMTDSDFMSAAIALAAKGRGYTSPNPMVGAVVVKDGNVIGSGWHHGPGLPHAEVEAISDAGDAARGSELYVTLEPCNHFGRTPPCTQRIIDAGIRRVVVATEDPNPFVKGGGIDALRARGIQVDTGICRDEAQTLIEDFIWYVEQGKKPFVILKCASTLDGRIATRTGDSRWITSEKSRAFVHQLRHAVDGILIGAGTLRTDNPSLTSRIDTLETRDPRRIILDPHLSIDPAAKVLTQKSDADTVIFTAATACAVRRKALESAGATIIPVPDHQGELDLDAVLDALGRMDVMSLLIEGGSRVIYSALKAGCVNKVCFFIAPKFLGGDDGVPVCRGKGPDLMKDALVLSRVDTFRFDNDIMIQGYLK